MEDKIFKIKSGKVELNEHCFTIPWLNALNKYEPAIHAFSYVKYFTELVGPYSDYEESEKSKRLLKDFPGNYKPTDPEIAEAITQLQDYWKNRVVLRHFNSVRVLVNKLSDYAESVILSDDNITSTQRLVKDCVKTIKDFQSAEQAIEEELLKSRGSKKIAYDIK